MKGEFVHVPVVLRGVLIGHQIQIERLYGNHPKSFELA